MCILDLYPEENYTEIFYGQVGVSMQTILFSLTLWSFLRAQFDDCGVVPLCLRPPTEGTSAESCKTCGGWKPPRAHHSRRLNRCVFRMDHVCNWINNVVGYGNQKCFVLFLFYAFLSCVFHLIVCSIYLWYKFHSQGFGSWDALATASMIIHVVIGFVVKDFLSEQIESIESNVTLIETFKNCHGDDSVDVFRQIFGPNPLLWLIPVHTTAPPDYTETVVAARRLSAVDADSLGVELTSEVGCPLDTID